MMANYLVCGVAGFIGYQVALLLLKNGHTVFGVDNINNDYDIRLKKYRLCILKKETRFYFRRISISNNACIKRMMEFLPVNVAGLINLAAHAGVRKSLSDPWKYIDSNIIGNLNLLELCYQYGIKKYVLASSSSLYSQNNKISKDELSDTNHPLQPYAASKKGAEVITYAYSHLYDIDATILRYFTVYGPAGRPDMAVFRFCKWISEEEPVIVYGNGEQSRGFTFVEDIAKGTILALKPLNYEIINLGGDEIITVNRLIKTLESRIGKKANIVYQQENLADIQSNHADIEKAKTLLDWEPKICFEKGIDRVVDWYNKERLWVKSLKIN